MMRSKHREIFFILAVIVGGFYFTVSNQDQSDGNTQLSTLSSVEEMSAPRNNSEGLTSVCEKVDSISESPKMEATGLPLAVIFYLHSGKIAGLYAPPEIYMYKDYFYSFQLRRMNKNLYEVLEINPRHCESKKQPKDLKIIIPRLFEDRNIRKEMVDPTLQLAGVFFILIYSHILVFDIILFIFP